MRPGWYGEPDQVHLALRHEGACGRERSASARALPPASAVRDFLRLDALVVLVVRFFVVVFFVVLGLALTGVELKRVPQARRC